MLGPNKVGTVVKLAKKCYQQTHSLFIIKMSNQVIRIQKRLLHTRVQLHVVDGDLLQAFSRVGKASSGGQKNADLFILFSLSLCAICSLMCYLSFDYDIPCH